MRRMVCMLVPLALLSSSAALADAKKKPEKRAVEPREPEDELTDAERARFDRMKISKAEADQIRREMGAGAEVSKGKEPGDKAKGMIDKVGGPGGSVMNKGKTGGKGLMDKARGPVGQGLMDKARGPGGKGLTDKARGPVGKGMDKGKVMGKAKAPGNNLVNKGATAGDKLKKKPRARPDFIPPPLDPTGD